MLLSQRLRLIRLFHRLIDGRIKLKLLHDKNLRIFTESV